MRRRTVRKAGAWLAAGALALGLAWAQEKKVEVTYYFLPG
jgi:hypothetical protein